VSGEENHSPQSSTAKPERHQLFISYSHKDREWVERLRTMLRPLEQRHGLEFWDDSRIQAGDLWREEIEKALAGAQVALLMVSADFLDSDFVTREELPKLFHGARQEGLRILWVPLRPCLWEDIPEIEQYQAVIPPGQTLAQMAEVEQEVAFVKIAKEIKRAFQEEAQRLAREKEDLERSEAERVVREREEQQRQRAEAESEAHGQESAAEPAPLIHIPWPESSGPALPEGAERSIFSPLETATVGRAGTTWEIQHHSIETWGFRERLSEGVDLKMVAVPKGRFTMGSPEKEELREGNEGPQHEVRLKGFFLAQTPITQAQWREVAEWEKVELDLNPDPSHFKRTNHPVEQVNWFEAREFCRRLSNRTGRSFTLPSEAQWEYACRAGTTTPFNFGEMIFPELANYDGTCTYADGQKGQYRQQSTPVGSFPSNAWGLQDMHGNVWEMCLDHRHENYAEAPVDGFAWIIPFAGNDEMRVGRGGSWFDPPGNCRSACRHLFGAPGAVDMLWGFRVACIP
jgi:formylglycine-generating enzyme required for sulfatase activity